MASAALSTIIFKEKYVQISYNSSDKILIAEWNGFLLLDEVIKATNFILDFIEEEKIIKYLSIQSDLKILSKDIRDYYTNVYFYRFQKTGILKVATILSKDPFAFNTTKQVLATAESNYFKFSFFDNDTDAINWLNQ